MPDLISKQRFLFLTPGYQNPLTKMRFNSQESWGIWKILVDLVQVIGAKSFSVLTAWVDAAYAVHKDMRSHTGGLWSLRTGNRD